VPLNPRQVQALESYREARRVVPRLTEAEVLEALAFERKALKRKHVVDLLISRATNLYKEKLKNGT